MSVAISESIRSLAIPESLEGYNCIDVTEYWLEQQNIPDLPHGYAYKGGVARSALIYALIGQNTPIRDIDIIAIEQMNPDLDLADGLAEEYMPEDYANGYGVEHIEDVDEYFEERDFTFNEVLLIGNQLFFTDEAKRSILESKIVGSRNELDMFGGTLGPKIAIKALLLKVALRWHTGEDWEVEGLRDYYYDNAFHIALGLNKAGSYDEFIVEKFVQELEKYGYIGKDDASILKLFNRLEELVCFGFDEDLLELVSMLEDEEYVGFIETLVDNKYHGSNLSHMQ